MGLMFYWLINPRLDGNSSPIEDLIPSLILFMESTLLNMFTTTISILMLMRSQELREAKKVLVTVNSYLQDNSHLKINGFELPYLN
jgi:hypothetical protein